LSDHDHSQRKLEWRLVRDELELMRDEEAYTRNINACNEGPLADTREFHRRKVCDWCVRDCVSWFVG